jgi:threonyl-tRNA synthetase
VDEALLVLASVEKKDEANPKKVVLNSVREISAHAGKLNVQRIILHPFAHLFADLSKPKTALEVLILLEEELVQHGFSVVRTPFGWFNSLEIKAKGHPLSRVARVINNR